MLRIHFQEDQYTNHYAIVLAGCAATSSSGIHTLSVESQPVLADCTEMCATIRKDNSIFDAIICGYTLELFENPRFLRNSQQSPKGLWLKKEGEKSTKVVVPNIHPIRQHLIFVNHSLKMAGHPGRDKTIKLVMRNFWWSSLTSDVEQFVATCDACQRAKSLNRRDAGLLRSLPIPSYPWMCQWILLLVFIQHQENLTV